MFGILLLFHCALLPAGTDKCQHTSGPGVQEQELSLKNEKERLTSCRCLSGASGAVAVVPFPPFRALGGRPKTYGVSSCPSRTAGTEPKHRSISVRQSSTLCPKSPTKYRVVLAGKYHRCQNRTICSLFHSSTCRRERISGPLHVAKNSCWPWPACFLKIITLYWPTLSDASTLIKRLSFDIQGAFYHYSCCYSFMSPEDVHNS